MAFAVNTNKRVFYAMKGVAIGDFQATSVQDSWAPGVATDYIGSGKLMIMHGVQSMGINTNFNLEGVFEFGQLSLYDNVEEVPDIEVTIERVLDGYTLAYHAATVDAVTPTLTGRADARCDVRMAVGLFSDTAVVSGNSGVAELYCSGMYLNSVSYNFATDGNFTESITLVGNDKEWLSGADTGSILITSGVMINAFASSIFGNDAPATVNTNVLRRQNLVTGSTGKVYGSNTFYTVVPDFIEGTTTGASGISTGGLASNCSFVPDTVYLSSASVSVDLGREQINQLGTKLPYLRYVSFPVDVNTEITATATAGDNVSALSAQANLSNHSIQFVLDDSTILQLGNKNKVTSISYGGGDAGGGNDEITYSLNNKNDFVVLHSGDPMTLADASYFIDWYA